jgi:hypothetical protein
MEGLGYTGVYMCVQLEVYISITQPGIHALHMRGEPIEHTSVYVRSQGDHMLVSMCVYPWKQHTLASIYMYTGINV